MRRKRTESDWQNNARVPLLVSSVFIVALMSFSLIYFMEIDVDHKRRIPTAKTPKLSCAVVLQSSPVDPHEQEGRLKVIDETWSNWRTKHIKMTTYAAINNDVSFKNLNKINLGANAINNMGRLKMTLLRVHEHDWQYILLANDHSFIIPHNLEQFLISLPRSFEENLVYSGHKLALNRNQRHMFASGGAGLLMSRPCVSLLISVWALINPKWCGEDDCTGRTISQGHRRVRLSRILSLVVDENSVTLEQHGVEPVVVSRADIRSCIARKGNTWEEENFGVVVSHCLLDLFHAEFPSALDMSSESELFNVYDPVRVLRGDVDDWWIKAKSYVGQHMNTNVGNLSSAIISWHYVNSAESRLLYRYLHDHGQPLLSDPSQLMAEWKVANWAYGRGPKTREEASVLLNYFSATRRRIS